MITIEIAQKTVDSEIELLTGLQQSDEVSGANGFVLGALVALTWLSQGGPTPATLAAQLTAAENEDE